MCNAVIKKVAEYHPDWKMNIKYDNDNRGKFGNQQRGGYQNNFQPPHQYQQHQNFQRPSYVPHQNQPFYNQPQFHQSSNFNQNQFNESNQQKIVGQKPCNILVRQIWLGGIPQMCDKNYMHQLMSQFGIIQNLQIFPKFAFIKFRLAEQATIAFQRAQRIYTMFGNPLGFRIFFSDPSRRANIVSNHYQYDRQSPYIPVLFLGFPPVTSANVDLDLMKEICQKYGVITNSYMRKNSNSQTRSYIMFTYSNIKDALRAKMQLSKRRDLLGDKRVQVTLLLDQEVVLRGKDLSHTQKMFQAQSNTNQKKKSNSMDNREKPSYSGYGNFQKQIPSSMQYGMYQPPPIHYGGFVPPQHYSPNNMYYNPQVPYYSDQGKQKGSNVGDVHQILQSVLQKPSQKGLQKKPNRNNGHNQQNVTDIVNKILGPTDDLYDNKQPSWSGFLTWKGLKRVGVDGHTQFKEPQDYVINIMNVLPNPADMIIKQKATMILQPTNAISQPAFKQYVNALKNKVGVSVTQNFLMYVIGKCKESDQILKIKQNQLLVIMEKPSLLSLIKQKLVKCDEQLK